MPNLTPEDIAPQMAEICQILARYPTSHPAQRGSNFLIIGCRDGAIAASLAGELRDARYTCIVRRGRITDNYYVQVTFNPPK